MSVDTPRFVRVAFALGLLWALSSSLSAKDRLLLESGGTIVTDRWWYEGDWIYYENSGGVMGLPRSAVLRIDKDIRSLQHTRAEARSSNKLPEAQIERQRLPDPELRSKQRTRLLAGREFLESSQFEEARTEFERVLTDDAYSATGKIGLALALQGLGQERAALNTVLDGLSLHPEDPELHEVHGNLKDREERLLDAVQAWRRADTLRPSERLKKKIAKAERDLAASRNYSRSSSSHFNVRYDGNVSESIAGQVLDFLESQHWRMSKTFAFSPAQPITVVMYAQEEFKQVTQSADWVGGLFDGKIRVPLGGIAQLPPRGKEVLTHELAHAFIHAKGRGQAPWWFHEGVAQWLEGQRLSSKDARAVLGAGTPLDDSRTGSVDRIRVGYAAALGFVTFLGDRRGELGLSWLLELFGDGADHGEALRQVYGYSLEELQRSYADAISQSSQR